MKKILYTLLVLQLLQLFNVAPSFAQTRSPWQKHYGAPLQYIGVESASYGDSTEYIFENIPPANDTGWSPAPDPDYIKFKEASAECFITDPIYNCRKVVDYTYFQTYVSYPSNMQLTRFTILLNGLDDGCRLTVFNATHPNGFTIPGFVKLGDGGKTFNLIPYATPCYNNRFVVTHVDDCCGGVVLDTGQIIITGTLINDNVVSISSTPVSCSGGEFSGTATASSTGVGPFTYLWNTIPAQTTATATGLGVGTYTCTVTPSQGCSSAASVTIGKAALQVNIKNPPTLNINTCAYGNLSNIILGYPGAPQTLTLQSTITGGAPAYTYTWTGNGSQYLSSKTIKNPVFNPAAQTSECKFYSLILKVNDSQGCVGMDTVDIRVVRGRGGANSSCGNSQSKKILICHVPPGNTSNPQTISISTNALSAHTFGPSLGPSPTSLAHKSDCIGSCGVQCSTSNRFAEQETETETHFSLTEFDKERSSIVPNPNNGNFSLLIEANQNDGVSIAVFNLMGEVIDQQILKNLDEGTTKYDWSLDKSKTPDGIYFVSIRFDSGERIIKKITIKRE